MLIKRTAIRLFACGVLALLARGALAQPANSNLDYQDPQPNYANASAPYSNSVPGPMHSLLPLGPMNVESRMELFGPAEISGYGNGPRPKIGWFGSYERLFWSFAKPKSAFVGDPFAPPPVLETTSVGASVNTGWLTANGAWGNRWEIGYFDTNNRGWLVGVLDHVSQGQYKIVQNPQVRFDDPAGLLNGFVRFDNPAGGAFIFNVGELPYNALNLTMKNVAVLNGVELMQMYRAGRKHKGGFGEIMYGARWLQLNDTFVVTMAGNGDVQTNVNFISPFPGGAEVLASFPTNLLDSSTWSTRVINNMVGPQIAGRWWHQREHWIVSLEARFMAAANFQNVHQTTLLGDQAASNSTLSGSSTLRVDFKGIGGETHQFTTTFAPVGELRLNAAYQVTSNVALKVGYTGLYIGNISRASNRIDYTGPQFVSILNGNTHQTFFSNGLSFGFEVNR